MRRATISAVLATLLCLSGGCARWRQPNVLFIVIDTLRPDRLGLYGSTRALTPFLDELGARGFVFRNTYAQTSWTNASIASLFTSRYQVQHHVTSFRSMLGADEHTLPETLQARGYVTAGFSANFLVHRDLGFAQGFDQYQTFTRGDTDSRGRPTLIKERGERLDREALAWLDTLSRERRTRAPVFLYLHYMEPHNPYDPSDALLDQVLAGRPRPDRRAINERMRLPNLGRFSDEQVQGVQDLYDAEVMSVDAELRRLFDALQTRGFLANAIVVLTADHGEEFREHGLMGHHQTLYEEVIRVPLIILVPGQHTRVDIDPIVSLTDVAPTLLDLLGVPSPPSFMGQSLRAAMGLAPRRWWSSAPTLSPPPPNPPGTGVAFSELIKEVTARQRPHEHAIIAGARKLILNVDGSQEFYDLRGDPGETDPGALGEPERSPLVSAMTRFEQIAKAPPVAAATAVIDPETRDRMRVLGYTD